MERKAGRKQPGTTSSSESPARIQRRLKAEQVADLASSYRCGSTIAELATRFGIHPQTVNEHLRRQGVPLRPLGLDPRHLEEAIRLYEDGWSLTRVGEKFGVGLTAVKTALLKAGVNIRPRRGWPPK